MSPEALAKRDNQLNNALSESDPALRFCQFSLASEPPWAWLCSVLDRQDAIKELRGIHFTQLTTIGGFDSLGPWFMYWLPPASGIYNKIRKLAVVNCCIVSQTAILSNPTSCTNLTQVDTPQRAIELHPTGRRKENGGPTWSAVG